MVLFRVAGGKLGRIFSFGLLLLVAAGVSRVSGQGTLPLYICSSAYTRADYTAVYISVPKLAIIV